jgi:1,4-alpha-glucan branching enzyme
MWDTYIIYELHPLRFTGRNGSAKPFEQVTEELNGNQSNDYLNELHITAVELMPINEFPTDTSWGYNPAFFYAVESSYGSPNDLKQLVDTAHQKGIAVILDVEINHGIDGDNDNILGQISRDTYYNGTTDWGPRIHFANDVAKHFFVQNMVYLVKEFHIDGFRFDFTKPIHQAPGGWVFLREIREELKAIDAGILLIAEELPNWWGLTSENVGSEWAHDWHGPFDSQWTDDFHDKLKDALTNGFANLDDLKMAFTYFGDSWHDGLLYTESHDEVGNEDRRIAHIGRDQKGWEMSQVSAAATLLARGIPMIFMGQEGGEIKQFGIDMWSDRLPLDAYQTNPGNKKVWLWYEKLIDIRRNDPYHFSSTNIEVTRVHRDDGIVAFTRDNGRYAVVLNFKNTPYDNYNVGVVGRYKEVANTSWPAFNLGASPEKTRGGDQAFNISGVHIPSYGAVVLKRED